jgi:hypothetical protein
MVFSVEAAGWRFHQPHPYPLLRGEGAREEELLFLNFDLLQLIEVLADQLLVVL